MDIRYKRVVSVEERVNPNYSNGVWVVVVQVIQKCNVFSHIL